MIINRPWNEIIEIQEMKIMAAVMSIIYTIKKAEENVNRWGGK